MKIFSRTVWVIKLTYRSEYIDHHKIVLLFFYFIKSWQRKIVINQLQKGEGRKRGRGRVWLDWLSIVIFPFTLSFMYSWKIIYLSYCTSSKQKLYIFEACYNLNRILLHVLIYLVDINLKFNYMLCHNPHRFLTCTILFIH